MFSINEASKLLGVSIETLRNWDKNGYLKANRTGGNHRRYNEDDILKYKDSKKNILKDSMMNHLLKLHQDRLKFIPADEQPLGGFTKEEIFLLKEKQKLVNDTISKEIFELFYKELISPYLFAIHIPLSLTDLVLFKRIREHTLVYESEDLVLSTHKFKSQDSWNFGIDQIEKNLILKTIEEIDAMNIEAIINNCNSLASTSKIDDGYIEDMIQKINNKTNTNEPKWILMSPENYYQTYKYNLTILNKNLKLSKHPKYKIYVSRFMEENKVLIGNKSENEFDSYIFAPYAIADFKDIDNYSGNKEIELWYGRKLLREGSKYHGLITIN